METHGVKIGQHVYDLLIWEGNGRVGRHVDSLDDMVGSRRMEGLMNCTKIIFSHIISNRVGA